jgi:hypothetical protein
LKAPSISAASQSASAISHRGPERQSDITTGEITNAIVTAVIDRGPVLVSTDGLDEVGRFLLFTACR